VIAEILMGTKRSIKASTYICGICDTDVVEAISPRQESCGCYASLIA
jgi:hypothetical protein